MALFFRIVNNQLSPAGNTPRLGFPQNDSYYIPDEYLENICPVCIEDFTEENPPYKIKFCNNDKHPFHKDCIMETFEKISVFCPVCRSNG